MPIHNPVSKITTKPIFDADGNVVAMVEEQPRDVADASLILSDYFQSQAKPLQGNTQRHMRHVAELPAIVVNDLMRRGIWHDKDALLKWIETEGRHFKSYQGRIA